MFRHEVPFIVVLLLFVAVPNAIDIGYDYWHGAPNLHLIREVFVVLMSLAAIAYLARGHYRQSLELARLETELAAGREQVHIASEQMRAARRQYGETIQAQFGEWHLTQSEKDVALLLLKGLSLREIALVRHTMEKTVRQQASDIYSKSGVTGRYALSAWFFEDFL
jgi:DNA-binding NarL/FixJ family response regulator|tara:strand:+ start:1813 stop:2310 length:498 start_codon:yes stop_codon:yes gene_type:complete